LNFKEFLDAFIALKSSGGSVRFTDDHLQFLNPVDVNKLRKVKKQLLRVQALQFDRSKSYRVYKSKKSFDGRRGYLVGLLFEELIQIIFEESQIFALDSRVVTDSCEIDFFIHVLDPYKQLFGILNGHQRIFGEAKCHLSSAKSEWVNTLSGKMVSNGTRSGMIFTFKAGAAPSQFRAAIKDHFRSNPAIEIVPWGPTLVDELIDGKPFLRLLQVQHNFAYVGTNALVL
jgi:hypothetical protein